MTYQISIEQIQKLVEINKMLNLLEIKGLPNISMTYTSMIMLKEVLDDLQKQSEGIVVDNTKGGK
jgi:hypothetical protein